MLIKQLLLTEYREECKIYEYEEKLRDFQMGNKDSMKEHLKRFRDLLRVYEREVKIQNKVQKMQKYPQLSGHVISELFIKSLTTTQLNRLLSYFETNGFDYRPLSGKSERSEVWTRQTLVFLSSLNFWGSVVRFLGIKI